MDDDCGVHSSVTTVEEQDNYTIRWNNECAASIADQLRTVTNEINLEISWIG